MAGGLHPPGRDHCRKPSSIPPLVPAAGALGWHSTTLGSGRKINRCLKTCFRKGPRGKGPIKHSEGKGDKTRSRRRRRAARDAGSTAEELISPESPGEAVSAPPDRQIDGGRAEVTAEGRQEDSCRLRQAGAGLGEPGCAPDRRFTTAARAPLPSSSAFSHHRQYIPCGGEYNSSSILNKHRGPYMPAEAVASRTRNHRHRLPIPAGGAFDAPSQPHADVPGTAARTAGTEAQPCTSACEKPGMFRASTSKTPHRSHGSPSWGQIRLYFFFHSPNAQISYFFPTKTRQTKDHKWGTV